MSNETTRVEIEEIIFYEITSMLSSWIWNVSLSLDGRAFATQFGADEKNVRNILSGKVKRTMQKFENLIRSYIDALPNEYINLTDEERRAIPAQLLKEAENARGLLSAFFKSQDRDNLRYSETVKLATHIDAVSEIMSKYRDQDDLIGFKKYIMLAETLDDNYWICPSKNQNMKPELALAKSWVDIDLVITRVRFNVILSVMAMYDIEYVTERFKRFRPMPLLLGLAPQAKINLQVKSRNIDKVEFETPLGFRGFRDIVDTPMSLLTDWLSAIVQMTNQGEWPKRQLRVSEMPDIISRAEYEDLVKIRHGEMKLNIYKICDFLHSTRIGIGDIYPLIVAAYTWDKFMLPIPSTNERKAIVPDDDYMRFWNYHRAELSAKGKNIEGGNYDWPAYLARRSQLEDRLGNQEEGLY